MNNCTLLQTTEAFLCRKSFKAEPTVIDVTPVPVQAKAFFAAPSTEASVVLPATPALPPAVRAPAPLSFLEVKPKARRASKKTAAQSFVELLIAAASLLFLAMT